MVTVSLMNHSGNDVIKIMDVTGKILLEKTMSGTTEHLDISSWPAGFYFYELRMNKEIQSGKICKQ